MTGPAPRPPGAPALRRPKHTAAATAFVQAASAVGLDVSARRTGEQEDRDFSTYPSTPVKLPAHTVVDLSASFEVAGSGSGRPGLTLSVRAENIFRHGLRGSVGLPGAGPRVVRRGQRGAGRAPQPVTGLACLQRSLSPPPPPALM